MSEDQFRIDLVGTGDDFSRTAKCSKCGAFLAHYTSADVETMDADTCGWADHRIVTELDRKMKACPSCDVELRLIGDYTRQGDARAALARKD